METFNRKIDWVFIYLHIATLYKVESMYTKYLSQSKLSKVLANRVSLDMALHDIDVDLTEEQVRDIAIVILKTKQLTNNEK